MLLTGDFRKAYNRVGNQLNIYDYEKEIHAFFGNLVPGRDEDNYWGV
jgi:hypothetical protein